VAGLNKRKTVIAIAPVWVSLDCVQFPMIPGQTSPTVGSVTYKQCMKHCLQTAGELSKRRCSDYSSGSKVSYGSFNLETLPETDDGRSRPGRELRLEKSPYLGFIVLWNSDEPLTIGAFLPVAVGIPDTQILGRGDPRTDDEGIRLCAWLQRPGGNEPLPALQSPTLSRVQLLVRGKSANRIELTNVGRRRLLVNGDSAHRADVGVGDVIELGSQLVLLCAQRPRNFESSSSELSAPTSNYSFGKPDLNGFVGESPAAWRLRYELSFVAGRRGHVLIFGNTGTGKELVANAVHGGSKRVGPLVARNAATIPETLVDAELFGNMKGYPNPGVPERKGLFGAAHTGCLFLDEFADLPSMAQAHILRVLDAGQYHRLGEDSPRRSDFRLIAATNRSESMLRTDVLARFEFRLRTPDLNERPEDIPLIAKHLFSSMCDEATDLRQRYCMHNGLPRFTAEFVRKLVQHPYEGNVRELRRLLWLAVSNSQSDRLEWPEQVPTPATQDRAPASQSGEIARDHLQRALEANNGSIEKTWRALGLPSRHVLNRLLRKHGVSVTKQHRHA